jgi:hypothetical protein
MGNEPAFSEALQPLCSTKLSKFRIQQNGQILRLQTLTFSEGSKEEFEH